MNVKIQMCPNCGEEMKLGAQKISSEAIYYLYWYCENKLFDDCCENNGRVTEEGEKK